MDNLVDKYLKNLIFIKDFKEESINDINKNGRLLKYSSGQPIINQQNFPNNILIILKGEARLLTLSEDNPKTIAKLGEGVICGLSSILCTKTCEEIQAATDLIGISIPVDIISKLYSVEKSFKDWCNQYLLPGETLSITESLIKKSPRTDINIKAAFKQVLDNSKLLVINNQQQLDREPNYIYYTSSNNIENEKSDEVIIGKEKLSIRGPLYGRILGIPEGLHNAFMEKAPQITNETNIQTNLQNEEIENAPILPEIGNPNLGQYKPEDKFKLIRGKGEIQETQACLQMLANQLDLPFRKDSVEKILRDTLREGNKPTLQICGGITSMLGLHSTGAKISSQFASRMQTPSIINWKDSFALVLEANIKEIKIASPKDGIISLNPSDIKEILGETIEILMVDKTYQTPEKKFGIQWFWPALKKYRGVLIQVLIASFVVQLFGLANPLLIQVIIDKVISQRSLDTLEILGFALVVVTILGGIIGSLRTFLFTETTNRIDTRLGAEVIDHLLRLPLKYYDQRPVGELGSRVAELEKIRNFLTGQALTTLLDAAFSLIYIVVMVLYSWLLTIIALGVVPLQILLTLLGTPLIRRQIRDVAQQNAKTQSHLIEVLTGIQTVKAQNVETVSRWKWQDLYTKYISRTFEKTITGTALGETSNVFQQLSQLLVLWVGATLVLKGQLTLGQLIAFRIISGYVTQPILRLSSIWQNIQELRVSFERLADIIDTPEESSEADKANIPLPSLTGSVKYEGVSFSFSKGNPDVLNNIDLEISPGKFIGIVGQSGSGKSTLMKLLPRLYEPRKGRILIDGYDISKVELYSLRRQIGIVPQDPLLFAGTVSENIALTNPDTTSDEIVRAAKIACAHEFIMQLPQGYSSNVGERGAGLSGGQRQRIAIARTLLSKPKLLIMDEATSALDYDTERKVCENMRQECKGSTVFFITHRLNTIKNADNIILLDKGYLEEIGQHDELMNKQGRYYALFRQQEAN